VTRAELLDRAMLAVLEADRMETSAPTRRAIDALRVAMQPTPKPRGELARAVLDDLVDSGAATVDQLCASLSADGKPRYPAHVARALRGLERDGLVCESGRDRYAATDLGAMVGGTP